MNRKVTIVDEELGRKNFKHAGEHLCELWSRDLINGQPVAVTYVEEHDHSVFLDTEEVTWDWIDRHARICKYSLDLRRCDNRNCCGAPRAFDVCDFLSLNDGFLPPVIQDKDKHFLSLLHTLEYVSDRLPGYDQHCPSISPELYNGLVCKKCGKYFPTKAFIKKHVKTMHSSRKEKIVDKMKKM